ncbi:MAG TPA: type IV pilus assembly protein PilM [Sedimentisphaerales bacterium]|nr:type IV pilus assembly protein PilM [Sedimentisphaerales bacterium]
MASKTGAVWAIDIGSNSLKAMHLSAEGNVVEVTGFDNIQHGKVVTGDGVRAAERDELVALSLRQFVEQNNLGKDDVIISVPSQNSFARFVNLPPVEEKRIPEIVKFEAVQQIPFDINDVQWDWQLMTEAGSAESRVGIFAIKNEVVNSAMEHFGRENIQVGYVQMAPMALYNYVLYDHSDLARSDDEATVVLNIGAENTDLVVCTSSTVWQRCILIGGNAFTKAIANTFKLNFEKAEKLKRTAPMSKYARQIFQAMRPVFTDLATEIQRSLGFYRTSNPNTKLSKIIALGGGTKMRGLLKYLQQTVEIPVERPDSFKKLAISSGVSAAKFHESVSDFGIVYGLGLQALGLGRIESNLLPRGIARSMAWANKAKYFTATAGLILLVSVLSFGRALFDKANYSDKSSERRQTSEIIYEADQSIRKVKAQKSAGSGYEAIIQKELEVFNYRDIVPLLTETIISALPNEKNNPNQSELYRAFAAADVETVLKTPRKERKQIFITDMQTYFVEDVNTEMFASRDGEYYERNRYREQYAGAGSRQGVGTAKQGEPGFLVTIVGHSPYKNIDELMDPAGVEDDRSKWGFITRLTRLDDIVDGNSPFKLYKKTDVKHFNPKSDPVEAREERGDTSRNIFTGIGVEDIRFEKTRTTREIETQEIGVRVLIDPMTKEIISKVAELDEDGKEKLDGRGKPIYTVNDYWFRLNVKFLWKDAPAPPVVAVVAPAMAAYPGSRSSTPAVPVSGTQVEPTRGRRTIGLEDF